MSGLSKRAIEVAALVHRRHPRDVAAELDAAYPIIRADLMKDPDVLVTMAEYARGVLVAEIVDELRKNYDPWRAMPDSGTAADFVERAFGVEGVSRNIITSEDYERNIEVPGSYTFNAFPDDDYEGRCFTVEALGVGEHAHLYMSTGRQIPNPSAYRQAYVSRGYAGHLIFAWADWEAMRDQLVTFPNWRIAEVRYPTTAQLDYYAVRANPGTSEK